MSPYLKSLIYFKAGEAGKFVKQNALECELMSQPKVI
jgi:hypothetical protein